MKNMWCALIDKRRKTAVVRIIKVREALGVAEGVVLPKMRRRP